MIPLTYSNVFCISDVAQKRYTEFPYSKFTSYFFLANLMTKTTLEMHQNIHHYVLDEIEYRKDMIF